MIRPGAGSGRKPDRIAVFRALQLGDLLVAVPAFRALRAGFPEAEITLIGLPWAEGFVRRFSRYFDRFVEFPGYPGIAEVPVDEARTEAFIREQRAYGYDLIIQMHGSGRTSNPLVQALGGRMTAGYYEKSGETYLSHCPTVAAPYPEAIPEILRNLRLAGLLGCPDCGTDLEFPLTSADPAGAALLLGPLCSVQRPWVGIHPGARPPARRWLAAHFAAVGDMLAERYDARIVLTGGPDEREIAADVARRMRTAPLNLAGRTTIGDLAAVIDQLDLFVSNDTGPAHLAVARATPSVTIFGPADPGRWAPLDSLRHPIVRHAVPCSPCGHFECPIDHRCLRSIQPELVMEVAETLLGLRAGLELRHATFGMRNGVCNV